MFLLEIRTDTSNKSLFIIQQGTQSNFVFCTNKITTVKFLRDLS